MAEDTLTTAPDGPAEAPAETSLRDDVARAFEQVETRDAPSPDAGNPSGDTPSAPAAAPDGRARGPDGRFVPGTPEVPGKPPQEAPAAPAKPGSTDQPKAPAAAPQGAQTPGAQASTAQTLKAPASWKPGAREHWGKLPAEVQQEVARRETEVGRVLHESARARDALSQVQQALAPYHGNIAASGGDVVGAIGSFFKADNTLRHGSIAEKATLVADIIKNYGVDLQALDGVLAGQAATPDPNAAMADQLRREMQAQLRPVLGYFEQMRGRQNQAMSQIRENAGTEVTSFAEDGAHEFFEDVRADMADIIDLYTARGEPITLQQAYDRAIMMNPTVSEVVAKRAEAERVNAAAQAAQRARRTAVSLSSAPAPAGLPGPAADDRRAVIEAAWEAQSGS